MVFYPDPLPGGFTPHTGGANDANHSHVKGIAVKEVSPSAFGGLGPHLVNDAATPSWNTYSTWDNRVYRNGDTSAVKTYGHGYIEDNDDKKPRFKFGAGIPSGNLADLKARVDDAWKGWQTGAKAEGEGSRTTPDGTALRTNLSSREWIPADGSGALKTDYEIAIDLVDLSSDELGAWHPANQTLHLTDDPEIKFFVVDPLNAGSLHPDWKVSHDALALDAAGKSWAEDTDLISIGWEFGAAAPTNAGAPNMGDIDYRCVKVSGCGGGIGLNDVREGTEADILGLGLKISNDFTTAWSVALSDKPITKGHIGTIINHEWGHLLGLDHAPAGIMHAQSDFLMGNTTAIDDDAKKAVAALYSIPVPEPSTYALAILGLFTHPWRRQRASATVSQANQKPSRPCQIRWGFFSAIV